MGVWNTSKTLVSLWAQNKKRSLERGQPETKVDSGGSQNSHSFREQEHNREKLREVKEIRESGGIIARMMRWKSLVFFGTGIELDTQDNEDLREWIHQEAFPQLDSLLIELGEDALWFPYALGEIVETRGGDFSHYEPIQPWTTLPIENEYGEVIGWEQQIQSDYGSTGEEYDSDEIQSFIVNKSSARDNTGISDVVRAEDTIDQFHDNRNAAQNAIDQAGYRRLVAKVGREDGGIIDDNELRRVRNRIDNLKEDTVLVTGPHVEFDLLDAMDPSKFKEMREMDMRDLALSLGVPIEFASVISEGLGSGEQSGFRERAFILEAKAAQRLLAGQFCEQVLKPVIDQYSPYDSSDLQGISFGEPMPDEPSINDQSPWLTTNEVREKLDKPPAEDEEIGESYRKPANIQAPEEEEPEDPGDGGIGGLFSDVEGRGLADPMINGHDLDPETGKGMCESTGKEIEAETMGDLDSDCPHCEQPLSVFAKEDKSLEDGGTDFRLEEFESWLDTIHEEFVTAEDTSKTLTQFNEGELPAMVKERLRQAIMSGSVFSNIESIPSGEQMDLQTFLMDALSDDEWSLDNLAGELSDRFDISEDRAELIARSETQSAVNEAAESAYNDLEEERGEEFRYKWVGQIDDRTTEACEWLLNRTNPSYGGDPVPLDELKELIQEAPEHDDSLDDNMARTWAPHPGCRKRYVRVVE